MSFTAAHESRHTRRLCASCRQRKALFAYRGRVRADRHHTLCFECYWAERNRRRAERLADVPSSAPLRSPFPTSLTPRQVAHRQAMLAHLAR